MIRLVLLLFLVACSTAMAQPQPRVTLDIDLSPPNGWKPNGYSRPGRLAVGTDGTLYVLLKDYEPASSGPAKDARLSLTAINRDGAVKFRTILPVRRPLQDSGYFIDSAGVAATRSGDLAVFISRGNAPAPKLEPGAHGTLFRLGADGRLKKETAIDEGGRRGGGVDDPEAFYALEFYVPTRDNALIVAGGFGVGPYAWWLGKFSLDGVPIWKSGPGKSFPERVGAVALRSDGTTVALVQEARIGSGAIEWHIHRYAADGNLLTRKLLSARYSNAAAVLSKGNLFILESDGVLPRSTLVHVDDAGSEIGRAVWPFAKTAWMIVDGDGFAAIVNESSAIGAPSFIVRADLKGKIRWKSPPIEVSEIALTPEGEIAALVWSQQRDFLHLMRYADP